MLCSPSSSAALSAALLMLGRGCSLFCKLQNSDGVPRSTSNTNNPDLHIQCPPCVSLYPCVSLCIPMYSCIPVYPNKISRVPLYPKSIFFCVSSFLYPPLYASESLPHIAMYLYLFQRAAYSNMVQSKRLSSSVAGMRRCGMPSFRQSKPSLGSVVVCVFVHLLGIC